MRTDTVPDVETAVLDRARLGDPEAFAIVVRHYDPALRALAYRLLGSRDRMDDALQEAYLKAFRALPRFRGQSQLGTWLHRIVFNACLDELRRLRRGGTVPLAAAADAVAPVPDHADRVAGRERLERALSTLAPYDRAAVLLVDGQGFDYRAAAEVLGIPAGTVASRLNRARAVLRDALEEPLKGVAES
ncbi:MAG TPA: sigma-70 family RNA polymerase sigma factor [Gaiella sp.]|jgi:RNA polymerase sigma-70 factor (ECF subfamily)